MSRQVRSGNSVTLLSSAARTVSGTGSDVTDSSIGWADKLLITLDVTAQSGTPTLDVVVQAKFGSKYVNLCRFAQIGASTGTKLHIPGRDGAYQAIEQTLEADPAVGSGTSAAAIHWADTLRVKWTIGGGTPSYTFSVTVIPLA